MSSKWIPKNICFNLGAAHQPRNEEIIWQRRNSPKVFLWPFLMPRHSLGMRSGQGGQKPFIVGLRTVLSGQVEGIQEMMFSPQRLANGQKMKEGAVVLERETFEFQCDLLRRKLARSSLPRHHCQGKPTLAR